MSNKIDSVLVFRVLKKMSEPFTQMESYKAGVIDAKGNIITPLRERTAKQKQAFSVMERMIVGLKKSSNPNAYVSALKMVREYVEERANEETAQVLLEKMENTHLIPTSLKHHDIGTYEGFMDAVEEVMNEMTVSGAGIGGAFDGAQSNAATNATGMAAPNGPTKKKRKGIENIINRRF